jgi:NhaP-type Na+/H+ or K+/H+ antiporter
MQGLDYMQLLIYALPGIIIGFALGYLIGGSVILRRIDRIGLGLVVGVIGGIILSLVLSIIVVPSEFSIILSVIAMTSGLIFGELMNWNPITKSTRKSHVIFNPDEDDEEFDRQIKRFMESGS